MYLYVLKSDALERVPEPLMAAFGKAIHAFDLVLSPERALSREDINKVLEKPRHPGLSLADAAGRRRVHRAFARRVAAPQRPGLTVLEASVLGASLNTLEWFIDDDRRDGATLCRRLSALFF
nr:hypothetical protein GCM10020185_12170 [Pseudomonas brassicacearum subsp. brassicacearum]